MESRVKTKSIMETQLTNTIKTERQQNSKIAPDFLLLNFTFGMSVTKLCK